MTGPGGRVGTQIVPLLREHFSLRLLDAQPLTAEEEDEVLQVDIRDFAGVREACRGIRTVIHLAAISDEDDFHSRLLPVNLEGAYNVFEAARQAGVKKILFASTGQTVLHYSRSAPVTPEMPVRPWTVYACTKVFGEALARYYHDQYGLATICLRICWFQPYDSPALRTERDLARHWCSPRDLTQLIVKAIRSDVSWGIFFGISNNKTRVWDISNARELLGYAPEDDSSRS